MKIQNLILAFYDKNQYENIASKRKTYNVTVTEAINRHTLALDNEKSDSFEIISSSEQNSRSSCDEQESEEEIDLETGKSPISLFWPDWPCLEFVSDANPKENLTHFQTMFHFYTPWKHQKTSGFLTFSGSIEVEHWLKMG